MNRERQQSQWKNYPANPCDQAVLYARAGNTGAAFDLQDKSIPIPLARNDLLAQDGAGI
jgi:hypothetical protein